jgi:hypothetical protein
MIMTLAGFGGGVRYADMTWPETAPTGKKLSFLAAGFFYMPPTRARPPSPHKIRDKWLE